ncbi:retinoic acid early-inducible protein 1-alpha-like [Sigmodon hispidus]
MSPVPFCFLFVPHLHVSLTDTHSLSISFTVKADTIPGQVWCEVHCFVDGVPVFRHDNVNKTTQLGDLGKAANATPVWTDLIQRVESMGKDLRMKLADTKQETTQISGHPTLQATMISQYEQGQTWCLLPI